MSGKLLIETVENPNFLIEEVDGKKNYFIEGVFIQTEKPNRNNRIYKFDHMNRVVENYRRDFINESRAWGELNHPDNPTINLDRVSHLITKLEPNGTNFWGKAKIVDTPTGNIVKGLLDGGGKLGVSTRGVGSLKPHGGYHVVQEDFQLATAGDIVANPSAQSAFVSALMENKEWLFENGKWHEVEFDRAKKKIKLAPKAKLEAVGLQLLEDFIKKI
jgi:hypothetical protein